MANRSSAITRASRRCNHSTKRHMEIKSLRYQGLGGPSECYYVVAELDGAPSIIFIQTPGSVTSVTNAVEDIVNAVLPVVFPGVRPDSLRYFLYYPGPEAIVEWQEVAFETVQEFDQEAVGHSWLGRLMREFKGVQKSIKMDWRVASPVWESSQVPRIATEALAGFLA